jgi:hypothetical protein
MIVPSTLAADFAQLPAEAGELGTAVAGRRRPERHEQPGRAAAIFELQDADETALQIDGTIDPGTVRQLENWIWEHFDARHHYLRHLAPDQFGDFTDDVIRKHHSGPLAHVQPLLVHQLLLVHRILSARKSMLLKVPLSVHDEMIRPGAVRRGRP